MPLLERRVWLGTRLRGSGNRAKLLHHTPSVQEHARRLDLPVLKPVNDHAPDPDHAVGRGNTEELAPLCA